MVADGYQAGSLPPGTVREPEGPWASADDRVRLMAYVSDSVTEGVLRDGFADAIPEHIPMRRGGIRAAISELQKIATPRCLIVDVSGEDEPLRALADLSQVVEPDVQVLVVGDLADVNFYREVTRGLGAREYLPKPLTRDMVVRLFVPAAIGHAVQGTEFSGGRVIAVTGARGGVGATTVAANLAWYFGVARNQPAHRRGGAVCRRQDWPRPACRAGNA
jgi:pilus assembly protein CpaE